MKSISNHHPFVFLILAGMLGCATGNSDSKAPRELSNEEKAAMLVGVANSSLVEGNPTTALKNLLEAERLDSSIAELHHSKALAYFQKKNLSKATESAERAVTIDPKFSAANNTLGTIYLRKGLIERAKPFFLKAIKDPLYREAFKPQTNLGIAYYRQKKWRLARRHFNRAIDDNPAASCVAYFYKGHLSVRTKKYDEAIMEYRRATRRQCARFPEAHYSLGLSYLRSKRYDDARKKFLEITELFPHHQLAEKSMENLRKIP